MQQERSLVSVGLSVYDAPTTVKVGGAGMAVVISALWETFTSTLVAVMLFLFAADILLGLMRSVDLEGVEGFDWQRFMRGIMKFGAGMVGVVLAVVGDLLVHETEKVPTDWMPFTTVLLTALCWGFFASATKNLAYFYPGIGETIANSLSKVKK
jgi:hypothetical protein